MRISRCDETFQTCDHFCLAGIRLAWAELESKRIHHHLTMIRPVAAASIIPMMYATNDALKTARKAYFDECRKIMEDSAPKSALADEEAVKPSAGE